MPAANPQSPIPNPHSKRRRLIDAVGLAGFCFLCGGVFVEFGNGWSLITAGAIALPCAIAAALRLSPPVPPADD